MGQFDGRCSLPLVHVVVIPGACPLMSYSFYPPGYQAQLMWELKEMFDPEYVLNPGVVLNRDPDAHIKVLKPSPVASPIVNRWVWGVWAEGGV